MSADEPLQSTNEIPDNTDLISDFAKRTREFGHYLSRMEMEKGRLSVEPSDRQAFQDWIVEARGHTVDPQALVADLVEEGRSLDYVMLADIYRQLSDLIIDVD